MGDCHSLDPGSKFGLEKEPNGYPGPGAYNFPLFQIQVLRFFNKTKQIMTVSIPRPACTTPNKLQQDCSCIENDSTEKNDQGEDGFIATRYSMKEIYNSNSDTLRIKKLTYDKKIYLLNITD
jgi:hypothetical protein